jgi:hypothetical protein
MNFYVLRPYRDQLFGTEFAYADVLDPQNVGSNAQNGVCPCCGSGLGMLPWLPPHRVKLSSTRYPDLLWGAGFDLMGSERFRESYVDAGLQGIVKFDPPAEIAKIGGRTVPELRNPPPRYYNTRIVHDGADLDDSLSGARRPKGLCKCCRQSITAVDRVVFRDGSWNGADLFFALGFPGHLVASNRLKEMIEEHGLTNAAFIPAEDYQLRRTR